MDCDTHSPSVDRVDNPVPLCPDITKQSVPNLSALESSLKLGILSDEEKRKRSDILSTLYNTPVSSSLNAYFQMLEEGSSQWSIDMFIEGIKCMANLSGPERLKYFNEPFQGLHFSNSFTELWNKTHPQLPITLWDRDIRLRSPPSWSNELKESRHVLAYHGEAPLSQGLNELLKGPTTLDCGMFCQLVLWMAIRYLIGDRLFGKLFKFEKGQFVLTQRWEVPIDDTRTIGNLLYPFYDDPNDEETKDLDSQARIRTRTMFNHALYLFKHPGGVGRLQNVIQVDEYNIIFDPKAFQSLLSSSDIDQRFMQVTMRLTMYLT
uniref:Putative Holliday junction resolvase n=1 Tax=Talaromyces marneffei PM1 TaxID=1077442 RepID=A0A093X867_TALMA